MGGFFSTETEFWLQTMNPDRNLIKKEMSFGDFNLNMCYELLTDPVTGEVSLSLFALTVLMTKD